VSAQEKNEAFHKHRVPHKPVDKPTFKPVVCGAVDGGKNRHESAGWMFQGACSVDMVESSEKPED